MNALHLTCVVGARPNFMKMAPLLRAFERHPQVRATLVHTGQHYEAALSDVFLEELGMRRPDVSLAAAKMNIPVAHVEAGLRSFDRSMPEEINRIVTDSLSDLLLVSEPAGVENLRHDRAPQSLNGRCCSDA